MDLCGDGHVILSGCRHCHSATGCPVCAAKILPKRASEIEQAVDIWRDAMGDPVALLTLTVRHSFGDDPEKLLKAQKQAWHQLQTSRPLRRVWDRIGIHHFVRRSETTYGITNGFHPHLHVVLFLERELCGDKIAELSGAWKKAVCDELGDEYVPDDEHGCVLSQVHDATYAAKLALEVSDITSKQCKLEGHFTTWQLANAAAGLAPDIAEQLGGRANAERLWMSYLRATFGMHVLQWSKGARAFFHIDDVSDEQLVAEDDTPESERIRTIRIKGKDWDHLKAANQYFVTDLRRALVHGDEQALSAVPIYDGPTPTEERLLSGGARHKTLTGQAPSMRTRESLSAERRRELIADLQSRLRRLHCGQLADAGEHDEPMLSQDPELFPSWCLQ